MVENKDGRKQGFSIESLAALTELSTEEVLTILKENGVPD